MSLRPQQLIPPVPDDTARVARAAFRRGNPHVLLRDMLDAMFDDTSFADFYPALVLRRLLRRLRPGDVLMLHDGRSACTAAGTPVVLEVVPALLAALAARGLQAVPLTPPSARVSGIMAQPHLTGA